MTHFVIYEHVQILRMSATSLCKSHLLNSFIQQTVLRYISLSHTGMHHFHPTIIADVMSNKFHYIWARSLDSVLPF
jgi:hypothetical protein